MQKPNGLNQSRIVLKQDSTLIAVIEMSLSSWLVAGIVPGELVAARRGRVLLGCCGKSVRSFLNSS
jgi:hypothetical protein